MRFALVTILTALVLSSCFFTGQRIAGNGHIITQEKNVGKFTAVNSSGAINVHIMQGETNAVKIEADENLIPYLDIYVNGNTLTIRQRQGFNLDPSKNIIVYVSSPEFKKIEMFGSGDIASDNTIFGSNPLKLDVSGSCTINLNVNVPGVNADISGSGNIFLKGRSADLNISMSGSGNIKCFDLITDNVTLNISGSSDAEVTANKKLNIDVSGSGSVLYKGNPSINQKVSGSGEVKKAG